MLIFRKSENIKQINNDFEKLWNSFNYSEIETPGIKKDFRNKIKTNYTRRKETKKDTNKIRVTDSTGKVWWIEPNQVSCSFL